MSLSEADREYERLNSLRSMMLLDTQPEEAFDRITSLVRMALQTPIALVTLVDKDRLWFKSRQGLDLSEAPRSMSFCSHAIRGDSPLVIENAGEDALFRDHPLVLGNSNFRFYIGVPLKMRDGHNLGTLCAFDTRPRELSDMQIELLRGLASTVVAEMEYRRMAMTDYLTGALTRRAFDLAMHAEMNRSRAREPRPDLSLVVVDIDHFKAVNDRHGHAAGDLVLQSIVEIIRQELRGVGFVGRMGGEEFLIALPESDIVAAMAISERIRGVVAAKPLRAEHAEVRVTASFGLASLDAGDADWTRLFVRADAALYAAKTGGRNACVVYRRDAPVNLVA